MLTDVIPVLPVTGSLKGPPCRGTGDEAVWLLGPTSTTAFVKYRTYTATSLAGVARYLENQS